MFQEFVKPIHGNIDSEQQHYNLKLPTFREMLQDEQDHVNWEAKKFV